MKKLFSANEFFNPSWTNADPKAKGNRLTVFQRCECHALMTVTSQPAALHQHTHSGQITSDTQRKQTASRAVIRSANVADREPQAPEDTAKKNADAAIKPSQKTDS
ncbi:hypothetical protein [Pseudomonas luteola]|uniref:hypothetical protein n=1 Tax=Pseudomonas luteola TaxID=47886 RepID=UPI00163954DD|nr:hypothetical protein [Pseudomonas luteola]